MTRTTLHPTPTRSRRRRGWLIAVIIGLLVAAPVVWWLASPLWITNTVDEAFPFNLPTQAEIAAMPDDEKMAALEAAIPAESTLAALPVATRAVVEQQVQALATLMPDKAMDDAMPTTSASEWVVAAQGEFRDADSFHQGSGTQNYDIPAAVDLSQYRGVMIYCQPFHVVFSTAPFMQ